MDVKGPLPVTARGSKYIIVGVDALSMWPEAMAIPDKSSSSTALFLADILSRHGCPSEIVTDNGLEFQGDFTRFAAACAIDHRHTSPHHPQANGLVERMNQTLGVSLAALASEHAADWDLHLSVALWGYRASPYSSTKLSPFVVMYGREGMLPLDMGLQTSKPPVDEAAAFQDARNRAAQLVEIRHGPASSAPILRVKHVNAAGDSIELSDKAGNSFRRHVSHLARFQSPSSSA